MLWRVSHAVTRRACAQLTPSHAPRHALQKIKTQKNHSIENEEKNHRLEERAENQAQEQSEYQKKAKKKKA